MQSFAQHVYFCCFVDLNHEVLSLAEELVIKSNIALRTMQPFWIAALTAFRQSRYADCVILLLPQLESGLRLLFTKCNNCPNRLMTAEVRKRVCVWSLISSYF
uniref:Uncharacterized protein n=1 Tax=Varanus komodoensis TaxID=61221 RepID=A0A8D2LV18_VARKO